MNQNIYNIAEKISTALVTVFLFIHSITHLDVGILINFLQLCVIFWVTAYVAVYAFQLFNLK